MGIGQGGRGWGYSDKMEPNQNLIKKIPHITLFYVKLVANGQNSK